MSVKPATAPPASSSKALSVVDASSSTLPKQSSEAAATSAVHDWNMTVKVLTVSRRVMKIPLFLSSASFSELIAEMMAEPNAPSVERKDAESSANVPPSWSRAVLMF